MKIAIFVLASAIVIVVMAIYGAGIGRQGGKETGHLPAVEERAATESAEKTSELAGTHARPTQDSGGEDLDLESATRMLANFRKENTNINKRSVFAAGLIKKLCESGRSDDSFSLIEADDGQVRDLW